MTPSTTEEFGYVPKALLNWLVQEPNYLAQPPHLQSCLLGGLTIFPTQANF